MKLKDIIESIVNENIAYRMAIEKDIVNFSALAKKIKRNVDKLSGKDVPINTIVKLLTMYKKNNTCSSDPGQALKNVSISLDYGYSKKSIEERELKKMNFLIAVKNGEKVDVLFKDEEKSELALIKLKMKENFSEMPGITVLFISILEMFGIKVKYIYRIGHEIFFLLNKKDAPKALEKLAFYSSIQNELG